MLCFDILTELLTKLSDHSAFMSGVQYFLGFPDYQKARQPSVHKYLFVLFINNNHTKKNMCNKKCDINIKVFNVLPKIFFCLKTAMIFILFFKPLKIYINIIFTNGYIYGVSL